MKQLLKQLDEFAPQDAEENVHRTRIISLLSTNPNCFYRTDFNPGHVTGSALLISVDGSKVLMNHHKSLNKWLCFGGHADGSADIFDVARREVMEESGIENIAPACDGIVDVDVHPIPANKTKNEPAHEHFDIRYLFRARGSDAFLISEESSALRWCDYEEAMRLGLDDSMKRLLAKWQKRFKNQQ